MSKILSINGNLLREKYQDFKKYNTIEPLKRGSFKTIFDPELPKILIKLMEDETY